MNNRYLNGASSRSLSNQIYLDQNITLKLSPRNMNYETLAGVNRANDLDLTLISLKDFD